MHKYSCLPLSTLACLRLSEHKGSFKSRWLNTPAMGVRKKSSRAIDLVDLLSPTQAPLVGQGWGYPFHKKKPINLATASSYLYYIHAMILHNDYHLG